MDSNALVRLGLGRIYLYIIAFSMSYFLRGKSSQDKALAC